jgi:hypothetical protein
MLKATSLIDFYNNFFNYAYRKNQLKSCTDD